MQYQEAVTEFHRLDNEIESDQWRQAQLTWENSAPDGTRDGRQSLSSWARDVGKDRSWIGRLWRMWSDHGDRSPQDLPPFAETYRLYSTGFDDPEEALRYNQERRTLADVRNLQPERKAQVARELLADPDVARETFNAPEPDDEIASKARMHAGSAISRHDQRIQAHVQERRHQEAVDRGRTDDEAQYEIASMMQVLADVVVTGGRLARKMSEGATLPDGMRRTLAGYATKAKATIEWLEGIEDEQHAEDIEEVLRVWAAES
jgi:hypothetical protein